MTAPHTHTHTYDNEKNKWQRIFHTFLHTKIIANENNALPYVFFSFYPQSKHTTDIKTSVLYVGGQPSLITLDYAIKTNNESNEFRLCYYPHKLHVFSQILRDSFGSGMAHRICGDFKMLQENANPAFYIHIVEKH